MAQPTFDSLILNAGSGGVDLAGDSVTSKFWQAILVGFSTGDGTAKVVMPDEGLPIVAATGATWTVINAGTFAVQVDGNALTALQLLDDPVVTIGSAVPAKGQAVAGSDGTNARLLKTDTDGHVQVDVLSSGLPTGAATESTLGDCKTALQLIDNAISGAGFNVTQLAGAAVPIGAGTEAAAVRVTLATDSTGVVSVDDNAGSLTVDGTVTANAGTNLNTSALALETGGNLADCKTALQIVDDWDSSDDCRAIPQSAAAMDGATRCTVKRFRVKCGNGSNTLISAVADKKFRLRSLLFLATSATSVTAYLSTTTDTGVLGDATNPLKLDLDGADGPAGVVLSYNPDGWLETSTANEALTCTLSAAQPVWVVGTYIEVA